MPLVEQVKQMKEQGLTDEEISQQLKENGYSPLEINQALEQGKIKAAVSQQEQYQEPMLMQTQTEMQPSITETQQEKEIPEYAYPTQEVYPPEYQEQAYGEYQPYSTGAEASEELAEQIVEERIDKLKTEIGNITEFRLTTERRIKNLNERLKRIEEIIDRLQATILGKIGDYGQNINAIKREMSMMQDSFSKALPGFAPKIRASGKKSNEKQIKGKSKSKRTGIEHYLNR